MVTVIGIDPGGSGGIAVVGAGGKLGRADKMPETEKDIIDLLLRIKVDASDFGYPVVAVYLERVHSMPAQGVTSSFTFGMSYGGLRMAVIAAGLRLETVTPQKWQKDMGCLTKGDKNVSKRRAQELYPNVKITHAIADAILIATYGWRVEAPRDADQSTKALF